MNKKDPKYKKRKISFFVDPVLDDKIEILSKKYNISKSQMMRNFLDVGYDEAILLDSMGVLQTIHFGKNIFDLFKNAIKKGNFKTDGEEISFKVS